MTPEQFTSRLPAPFNEACDVGAHTSYGKRVITLRLDQPGNLHRNQYNMAWFDITEREPWRGEPLWVTTQRRTSTESWLRQPFTDAAARRIQADLLPAIQRIGFNTAWLALHRAKGHDGCVPAAEEAERRAAWWRLKDTLHQMHADGDVDFRPVPPTPIGTRGETVAVVTTHTTNYEWATPMASAWVAGEQVGWVTDKGDLVSLEGVLRARER